MSKKKPPDCVSKRAANTSIPRRTIGYCMGRSARILARNIQKTKKPETFIWFRAPAHYISSGHAKDRQRANQRIPRGTVKVVTGYSTTRGYPLLMSGFPNLKRSHTPYNGCLCWILASCSVVKIEEASQHVFSLNTIDASSLRDLVPGIGVSSQTVKTPSHRGAPTKRCSQSPVTRIWSITSLLALFMAREIPISSERWLKNASGPRQTAKHSSLSACTIKYSSCLVSFLILYFNYHQRALNDLIRFCFCFKLPCCIYLSNQIAVMKQRMPLRVPESIRFAYFGRMPKPSIF